MKDPSQQALEFARANNLKVHDIKLLATALIHPSYAQESGGWESNQRLEFLGDAVLNLVVAKYLYLNFPGKPEGILTKIRAKVVCEQYLVNVARALRTGEFLVLGRGEENSGGRNRSSILADSVEAVIGALYLDNGLEYVEEFILGYLKEDIDKVADGNFYDFKSRLQELVQSASRENVTYEILEEEGPAHNRVFTAGVFFHNRLIATGKGKSKKEAEQRAAEHALKKGFPG